MSSDKKNRKNMEKENNSDESDFSENEMPDLNSLNPFKFEPKTIVAVMMGMKVLNIK